MTRIQEGSISNTINSIRRYFQAIGKIHDLEYNTNAYNILKTNLTLFHSHWGHMSIIFLWITKILYHIGWNGNYEYWITNSANIQPLGHSLWNFNTSLKTEEDFSLYITSSVYYVLLKIKTTSNKKVYSYLILSELLSLLYLTISKINNFTAAQALN